MKLEINLCSINHWAIGLSSFEGGEVYEDGSEAEFYSLQIGLLLFTIDIIIYKK